MKTTLVAIVLAVSAMFGAFPGDAGGPYDISYLEQWQSYTSW
jgi:hypothetical protein